MAFLKFSEDKVHAVVKNLKATGLYKLFQVLFDDILLYVSAHMQSDMHKLQHQEMTAFVLLKND